MAIRWELNGAVAARDWLRVVFEKFPAELFRDRERVLRSGPVIVSLGALGRGFYTGSPEEKQKAFAILGDERID